MTTTNTALESLLDGLNAALRDYIRPGAGLFDPLDDKPTPPDHYGHLYAALALACAGDRDWAFGWQALEAWLALDPKQLGHLPFNRLALLLLRNALDAGGLALADAELIQAGLRRCKLHRSYPSNNWSLLAQTCRLIEAPAFRKPFESRRLCALLGRWTTPKGGFIDFPEKPGKRFSTPLAYHHKALFLTALACWFHDDAELARHARRLCDWLVHCWDPAGYAGGFGRTTHGLFGDGCLIAGLILLGIDDDDTHRPLAALATRLAKQRRPDGLLWLNPAGHESGSASWDRYMHISVYNAWAAGIIGLAIHLKKVLVRPAPCSGTRWTAARTGLFHDETAGLACLRAEDGLTALISTCGQPPQSYSRNEADFRYAGGVLIHLHGPRGIPLIAPPVRATRNELAASPALASWTPILRAAGEIYAIDTFHGVAISTRAGNTIISLDGIASELFRPQPKRLWQRVLATFDWRVLGGRLGRRCALHRSTLAGLDARLELKISGSQPLISASLALDHHAGCDIEYLNPLGHVTAASTLGAAAAPENPHLRFGEKCDDSDSWLKAKSLSSLPGHTPKALAPHTVKHGRSRWEVQLFYNEAIAPADQQLDRPY